MLIRTKRGTRRMRNQVVIDRSHVVTDYTGGIDLTAGKHYTAQYIPGTYGRHSTIIFNDDDGFQIEAILGAPSAHLDDAGSFNFVIK